MITAAVIILIILDHHLCAAQQWTACDGGYPYCGYDGCSTQNWCTNSYSWKATCEANGASYQWCAPMWTPLQPAGRCRLEGNDSGDSGQNGDYIFASGTISNILDCIDACIADGDDCVAIEYDSNGHCELWRSLPVMTQNTGTNGENCMLKGDQLGVENAGQECWGACGDQQGECSSFCGRGGRCCRHAFSAGNGCEVDDGVDSVNEFLCVPLRYDSTQCFSYSFDASVQGGTCTDGIRLDLGGSCTLECASGYVGTGGTVSCNVARTDPVVTTDCAELSCSVTSAIMTQFSVISDTTTLMPDTYITSDSSVAGGWGGTCSCPSGIPYEVGDNFDSCESLACIGGTEETCTNSYGSWSNRMVTCGETNPCVADSTNLVADQYCFVSCGAGLYGSGGRLTCTSSSELIPTLDCQENSCSAFNFPQGMIGTDCSTGVVLTTRTTTTCEVSCESGYEAVGQGIVQCPYDATFGQAAVSSLECHPFVCAPLEFPSNVQSGTCSPSQVLYANAQAGTSSCTVTCAAGYSGSGGTVTCSATTQNEAASFGIVQCTENECTLPDLSSANLVLSDSCSTPLTTQTNSECTTECASQYYSTSASSTGVVLCASDAQDGTTASLVSTPNCAEISCLPFSLPTGTIGDSSQGNACVNNVELQIVSRPSCDLKCDVGYVPSSSVVTCSSDAVNGVTSAQTSLICEEYVCSTITYPVATMSGNCNSPLTSVSSTSCELSCIPGYTGSTLIFNCDSTGNLNQASSIDSNYCTENRCASYFLSSSEDPYGTSPCSNGIRLYTNSNPNRCELFDSDTNQVMTVMCPSNSNDGGSVSIFPSSLQQITCSGFTLSTGMMYTTGSNACTEGIVLRSATNPRCVVSCAAGYSASSSVVTVSCPSNATDGDSPIPQEQCTENSCQALMMDTSISGVTCSQGLELTTVTNRSCTARCADGYYGDNGMYTCNPTTLRSETTMSCLEIKCAPISLPQGMIGTNNCSDGTILSTISSPSCEVSCMSGYESIGDGIVRCPIDATFGQAVESSLQCNPLMCAPLSIPSYATSGTCTNNLVLYANSQEGPTSCTVFCAAGYSGLGGTVACSATTQSESASLDNVHCTENRCERIPRVTSVNESYCFGSRLGTRNNNTCIASCATGYFGEGATFTCPKTSLENDPVEIELFCYEVTCSPYVFLPGVVSDDSSSNPCFNGNILVMNSSCDVKCDLGYSGRSGQVSCPYDSILSDPVVTNVTCLENQCASFSFSPGVTGLTCSDNVQLSTHTNPSCELSCLPGYSISESTTEFTLICPEDALDGHEISLDFNCDMNQCEAVSLPIGVIGDGTTPCVEGTILRTHANQYCEAICDEGYFGLEGYISCPQESIMNASTVFSGMCIEVSCNDFEFPDGVVSGDCVSGVRLTTHTKPTCALSCADGYFGHVELSCPENAVFGTESIFSGACEERTCAMNEIDWTGVSEENAECNRDTILSTGTNSNCTLVCSAGYRNVATNGVVRCVGEFGILDDSNLNCTENQCNPIVFNSSMSVVDVTENRDDRCENNMILSTHSNSRCVLLVNDEIHTAECLSTASQGDEVIFKIGAEPRCAYYDETCGRLGAGQECTIECGDGYVGVPGKIECPSNAVEGDAVNVVQVRDCVERICQNYEVLNGYRDSSSNPDVLRLSALTDPIRELYCEKGYTGTNLTVQCGLNGGTVSVSFSSSDSADDPEYYCRENVCRSIAMTSGIVTYGENGCVNGERLQTRTNRECEASCSSGYDFDTGHLVCSETANDDDDVTVRNLTCTLAVNIVSVLGSGSNGRRRMSSSNHQGLVCTNGHLYDVIADSISTDAQNQKLRFEPFVLNHGGIEEFFLEIEGQERRSTACIYDNLTTSLECDLPPGVGTNHRISLRRRILLDSLESSTDTFILDGCVVNYAPPVVSNITGCESEGCSRDGGHVVEIRGENFGSQGLVIFVNGEECLNVVHDTTEPHSLVRCVFPGLSQYQPNVNVLLVVQSDQFGAYHNFRFEACGLNEIQSIEDGDCDVCPEGSFTFSTDALTCDECPPGKTFGEQECEFCPDFTFNDEAGASACKACPGGKTSTLLREYCEECTLFYMWDPGHCDTPVFGIVMIIFLCLVILLVGLQVRKKFSSAKERRSLIRRHLKETEEKQEEVRKEIELMQKAWQINWDRIHIGKKVAAGGQGVVYQGTLQGLRVAVKTIFKTNEKDMMSHNEVKWMQRARHSRLVMFLGCGREPRRNNIFVVMEYMNGGNFLDALKSRRLSWKRRLRILCDVAEGMIYVHDDLDRVHRDLKSENILLCREEGSVELRGKVADFGLSGIEKDVICGTSVYMAPELLRNSWKEKGSSKAADIYAFGVILWEAMHQRRATTRSRDVEKCDEPLGYVDLMNVCLENNLKRRPPFKTIRESLLWMMKTASYQSTQKSRKQNSGSKKPKLPPRLPSRKRPVKRPPPPTPTRKNRTTVEKRETKEGQDFDDTTCTNATEIAVGFEIDLDKVENDTIDMMDL